MNNNTITGMIRSCLWDERSIGVYLAALADFVNQELLDAILGAATDVQWLIRWRVATTIQALGMQSVGQAGMDTLRILAQDEDSFVSDAAKNALLKIR